MMLLVYISTFPRGNCVCAQHMAEAPAKGGMNFPPCPLAVPESTFTPAPLPTTFKPCNSYQNQHFSVTLITTDDIFYMFIGYLNHS